MHSAAEPPGERQNRQGKRETPVELSTGEAEEESRRSGQSQLSNPADKGNLRFCFTQDWIICVFLKMQIPGPQHRPVWSFGERSGEGAEICA